MADDFKDILGVPRNILPHEKPEQKEKKEKAKRPEGMSREAFALLGAAHPIIASHAVSDLVAKRKANAAKPKPMTKGTTTYTWKAFTNPARSDGLQLYHWVRGTKDASGHIRDSEDAEYQYARLNKKAQIFRYDDEEWTSLIAPDSGDWTRQETDYLVQMAEMYDLRFVIMADRYEFPGGPPRSLEDLRERYSTISRRLLVAREGGEAGVANHPLVKQPYDATRDRNRRIALDRLMRRRPWKAAEENAILAEARAIEEKRKTEAGVTPAPPPPAPVVVAVAKRPNQGPVASAGKTILKPALPEPPAPPPGPSPLGPAPSVPAPLALEDLSPVPSQAPSSPSRASGPVRRGVPTLFDAHAKPFTPARPGVVLRSANMRNAAATMAASMAGGSRSQKALDAALSELGWPGAIVGPSMATHATCGAWLQLRLEVVALLDLRRSLQNRQFADDNRKRAEKRKK